MRLDLFSNMDYVFYNLTPLNLLIWVLRVVPLLLFLYKIRLGRRVSSLLTYLSTRVKELIGGAVSSFLPLSSLALVSCFGFICTLNLWGLFPGLFGGSCQMAMVLFLALHLWLTINISSIRFKCARYRAHLTPEGSPLFLVPLLNLIELVSKVIRPLTLTLRLCIKMTTGHILLNLLSLSSCFVYFEN